MAQLALSYDDSTPWTRLRGLIENAVNYLGQKEVVFELGIAKSTLSDALHDRNDRGWRHEWTVKVLAMLREQYTDTANEYMRAILEAEAAVTRRFEVVAADSYISPEDEATWARVEAKKRKARAR